MRGSERSLQLEAKLRRIRNGGRPRVLDLFAGCGGMTLGFVSAGCESVGGIERDPDAARSLSRNFHGSDGAIKPMDLTSLTPAEALAELNTVGPPGEAVDLVVGGPPCPTFGRIGRAKINSVQADLENGREVTLETDLFDLERKSVRMRQELLEYYKTGDKRNALYLRYIEYVRELAPLACLMENVPEFLNQGGTNHAAIVAAELESLGYQVRYTIINAADHGVPQRRERFFLVGIHESVNRGAYAFPEPTYSGWRPDGIRTNRLVATQLVEGAGRDHRRQLSMFDGDRFGVATGPASTSLPYVSAAEAIDDLPAYHEHREKVLWTRDSDWRGSDLEVHPYGDREPSPYAEFMRTWRWEGAPELEGGFPAVHHRTRHTMVESQRDVRLFEGMSHGGDYREAMAIALSLHAAERSRRAIERKLSAVEEARLEQEYIPPYPADKFPQKWWKIDPSMPVRTLTAHLGVDSYSHIHHDSSQARMITVQEAARLHSFPDRFLFRCGMNSAMRQIGNSVPPLLARVLARSILHHALPAWGEHA